MSKPIIIAVIAALTVAFAWYLVRAGQTVTSDQSKTSGEQVAPAEPAVAINSVEFWDNRPASANWERATFGAGCFWGVEAAFRKVNGVLATSAGYLGGTLENPTYREVCYSNTGHAEVVELVFDPAVVSYDSLLNVFWDNHNPTQMNRQGPDVGSQYRSAVFYYTPEQKETATASRDRLQNSGLYDRDIVTEITPASTFYRAEEYHQQYLEKKGLASCGIK
jgi:peptide-methionine (S)-S-oxide reductase